VIGSIKSSASIESIFGSMSGTAGFESWWHLAFPEGLGLSVAATFGELETTLEEGGVIVR